jgi:hypothetical protein
VVSGRVGAGDCSVEHPPMAQASPSRASHGVVCRVDGISMGERPRVERRIWRRDYQRDDTSQDLRSKPFESTFGAYRRDADHDEEAVAGRLIVRALRRPRGAYPFDPFLHAPFEPGRVTRHGDDTRRIVNARGGRDIRMRRVRSWEARPWSWSNAIELDRGAIRERRTSARCSVSTSAPPVSSTSSPSSAVPP